MPGAQDGRAGSDLSGHLSQPFILQTGKLRMGLKLKGGKTRLRPYLHPELTISNCHIP